jgi:NADPH-dependent 2,4-dienoyl-CoA reductase/sulfur reductase-like enzyme
MRKYSYSQIRKCKEVIFMPEETYKFVIVGGGLAGVSAVQGIREFDKEGSVLLIGKEKSLPYHRPPLSKKLWLGEKRVDEIFVYDEQFYERNSVKVVTGTEVTALNADRKTISCENGSIYRFDRLLLATGGIPRTLPIPGGALDGICYFRYLDDYLRMRSEAAEGKSAVIIGGGFIGSEIAAVLNANKVDVTMIFPASYLVHRVFPEYLGKAIQGRYIERGIKIFAGDKPVSFSREESRFLTHTANGKQIESDMLIVGVGMAPSMELAQGAGLKTGNGIIANEYLQTSHPDIYVAGDNAWFPYLALGRSMRLEHWDNALNQGLWAGRSMAGAHEPFNYMPYFFSDLFEFGYEAVGEVNAELETFADWQKENDTGVIYYLRDGKVRGVMMCNVWDKVDAARELIRKAERVTAEDLRGAIR